MTHPFCRCPANMVVMTLGLQSSGLGFESRKKTFLGSSKFQGKEWGQLLDFTGADESYVYPITREASRSEPTGSLKVSSRSRLSLNDSNNFDGQYVIFGCILQKTGNFGRYAHWLYTLHFLRTLSLSGNELENISSHISKAHSLEKLYLHSNQLSSIPKFSEFNNLQVLDLACNKINQLELASIVPKGLTYLDLSANCDLKIDPTDFQHLCPQDFGPTDLTSTYSVSTRMVFGGIGHRTQAFRSGVRCSVIKPLILH
ncbi:hypothetical protein TNCV_3747581 [Trichonephila clavipes]|nr:hypothetical protein TNCV_3747581 [Trichonephila clavipes]